MSTPLHPDDLIALEVIHAFRDGHHWGFLTFHFKDGGLTFAEEHRTYRSVTVDKDRNTTA